MTLREYLADTNRVLDGVVLRIPRDRRCMGMPAAAAIRSAWGMRGGTVGVWFARPGESTGRLWPVTGIDVETELMEWEVVAP